MLPRKSLSSVNHKTWAGWKPRGSSCLLEKSWAPSSGTQDSLWTGFCGFASFISRCFILCLDPAWPGVVLRMHSVFPFSSSWSCLCVAMFFIPNLPSTGTAFVTPVFQVFSGMSLLDGWFLGYRNGCVFISASWHLGQGWPTTGIP